MSRFMAGWLRRAWWVIEALGNWFDWCEVQEREGCEGCQKIIVLVLAALDFRALFGVILGVISGYFR